jgi:hypothetical protein
MHDSFGKPPQSAAQDAGHPGPQQSSLKDKLSSLVSGSAEFGFKTAL